MRSDRPTGPPDLAAAVKAYFARRWDRQRPISTADGVRRVRTLLPDCDLTDRALAQLIAERAIKQGYDVSFDSDEMKSN